MHLSPLLAKAAIFMPGYARNPLTRFLLFFFFCFGSGLANARTCRASEDAAFYFRGPPRKHVKSDFGTRLEKESVLLRNPVEIGACFLYEFSPQI